MNKIKIQFPYKMALKNNASQKFLLTTGHLFLAFNGLLFFIGIIPLMGIFLATIFFCIASLKGDTFSAESIKFSFKRLVLAILLIIFLYFISVETGKQAEYLWLTLVFIQLPLSINDAMHIYNGKIGMAML